MDIFSIIFNIKVWCVFLLETIVMSIHNIPFSIYKKDNHPYLSQNLQLWDFSQGLNIEFETAVVKIHQCSSH